MAGGGVADKALGALDTSRIYPVVTLLLAAIALGVTVFIPGGFIVGAIVVYMVLPVKFFWGKFITPVSPAGIVLGLGETGDRGRAGDSGKGKEEDAVAESEGDSFALRSAAENMTRMRRSVLSRAGPAGAAANLAGKGAKALLGKAGPIAALMYFITPMKDSEKITTMFTAVLYPVAFAAHVTFACYLVGFYGLFCL